MSDSTAAHAATLHKLIDVVWNQRALERMPEVFAEDAVMHYAGRDTSGRAAIRDRVIAPFQAAFPDMVRRIDDMVLDGRNAALRFTATGTHAGDFDGRAATGATLSYEVIALFRMEGERIAEVWAHSDFAARFAAL